MLLCALLVTGFCSCDSKWIRESYRRAEKSGRLEDLAKFIDSHPKSRSAKKARKLIAKRYGPVLEGHRKRSVRRPEAKRFFTRLLEYLRKHHDPRIQVKLAQPDAQSLADTDRMLTRLSRPEAPIVKLSSHFLGKTHYGYKLAKGTTAAFRKALGVDAVVFDEFGLDEPKPTHPTMAVQWKLKASGKFYSRTNARRAFAGIAIEATVQIRIPGASTAFDFKATVEPEANFKFSANILALGFASGRSSPIDSDVYGGMAESAFRVLGQRLLTDLTGITPPESPALTLAEQTRRRCEKHGDARACARYGRTLLDPKGGSFDKGKAYQVLKKACRYGHGCVDLAWMDLKTPNKPGGAFRAESSLSDGCRERDAESCRLVAEIRLGSDEVKAYVIQPSLPFRNGESVRFMVKACDLGSARACGRAADLFLDPQNPERDPWIALIFARRGCTRRDTQACTHVEGLAGTPHAGKRDAAKRNAAKQNGGRRKAAKPTETVLGVRLPKNARLFDVRYRVHYDGHPDLAYWVALPDGKGQLGAAPGRVTMDRFRMSDSGRPTTTTPPPGTAWVVRLTRWYQAHRCGPCRPGGMLGGYQSGCDCPIH